VKRGNLSQQKKRGGCGLHLSGGKKTGDRIVSHEIDQKSPLIADVDKGKSWVESPFSNLESARRGEKGKEQRRSLRSKVKEKEG